MTLLQLRDSLSGRMPKGRKIDSSFILPPSPPPPLPVRVFDDPTSLLPHCSILFTLFKTQWPFSSSDLNCSEPKGNIKTQRNEVKGGHCDKGEFCMRRVGGRVVREKLYKRENSNQFAKGIINCYDPHGRSLRNLNQE